MLSWIDYWFQISKCKDIKLAIQVQVQTLLQAMVGSHQEFVAVLKRLRGKNSDVSQEEEEIMVLYVTSNGYISYNSFWNIRMI